MDIFCLHAPLRQCLARPWFMWLGCCLLLVLADGGIALAQEPSKDLKQSLLNDPLVQIALVRQKPESIAYDFTIDSYTSTSLPSLASGSITLPAQPRFRMAGHVRSNRNLIDIRKRESLWRDGKWVQGNEYHQLFDGKRFWNVQQPTTPGLWCPLLSFDPNTSNTESVKARAEASGALEGCFPFFPYGDWVYAALMVPNTRVTETEDPVGGFPCRVVRFWAGPRRFTLWVDMKHGGLARQMEFVLPEAPPSFWRKTFKPIKPGEVDLRVFEVRDIKIEKVGDREIPVAGTFVMRIFYRNGKTECVAQRIQRSNVVMSPPGTEKFEIDLPDGSVIDASQAPLKYEWREDGLKPFLDPAVINGISQSVRQVASDAAANPGAWLRGFRLTQFQTSTSTLLMKDGSSPLLNKNCYDPIGPRDGLYGLFATCQLAGLDVKPDFLFRPEYIDKEKGSSVDQLTRAAREQGLNAVAASALSVRSLAASPYPILLRVKSKPYGREYDAWELFLGKREGKAWIWNLAGLPRLESFSGLAARWNGSGLVLSNMPIGMFRLRIMDTLLIALTCGILAFLVWRVRRFARDRGSASPATSLSLFVRRSLIEAVACAALALLAGLFWNTLSGRGVLHARGAVNIKLSRTGLFIPSVDMDQVRRISEGQENAQLIDARESIAFFLDHIPTAKNVPEDSTDEAFRALVADLPRDGRMVIYCSSETCHMAETLAARMAAEGFTRLEIYKGGWAEWNESKKDS